MNARDISVLLLLFVGLIGIWFYLPRFLVRRAMFQVIRIFREHNATSFNSAVTLDEIGLGKRLVFRMTRDYRPLAIQLLTKMDVVIATNDGKMYLSESKLSQVRSQGQGV